MKINIGRLILLIILSPIIIPIYFLLGWIHILSEKISEEYFHEAWVEFWLDGIASKIISSIHKNKEAEK